MESIADRTVVMRMPPPPEGEYYKRADVVEIVTGTVGRNGINAIGQLESVGSWEVVFNSQSLKCRFLEAMRGVKVDGKEVTTYPLKSSIRWVRITRIPYCVPHELLTAEIQKYGGKVIHHGFEVDPNDELMSNVRSYKVEAEDADSLPDRIEWRFEGLRGTGLVFVRGRKPRCDACGSRGHLARDCSVPYCRRCRQSGHFQTDYCGLKSYSSATTGTRADGQQPPAGSATAPPTGPTEAAPAPPPDPVSEMTAEQPAREPETPAPQPATSTEETAAKPELPLVTEPETTATALPTEPTKAAPAPPTSTEPETPVPRPTILPEPTQTGPWSDQIEEVDMADAHVATSDNHRQPSSNKERARHRESASEAGSDVEAQSNDRMETEDPEPEERKRQPKKSKTSEADATRPPPPKTSTPSRRRTIPVFDPTSGRTASRTPVTAAARRPN